MAVFYKTRKVSNNALKQATIPPLCRFQAFGSDTYKTFQEFCIDESTLSFLRSEGISLMTISRSSYRTPSWWLLRLKYHFTDRVAWLPHNLLVLAKRARVSNEQSILKSLAANASAILVQNGSSSRPAMRYMPSSIEQAS